nr:uncharacterized mitochondrial protein AtMg00810-like [Tanacetum cinerariifolium]
MAFEQRSLEPALHEMTTITPSSGLIPNHPLLELFVPPSKHEWDLVLQLVLYEFFSPLASVASRVHVEEALAPVELTGLHISQSPRGIFLNQSKYAIELLKKYEMVSCNLVDTSMVEKSKLDKDTQGKAVDPTHYHGMVGILMYLTSSRSDMVYAIWQVENGVFELYFVRTEYQLVDIFTKALCRERIEFLIDKLGMRSFTLEKLKELADEAK